MSRFQFPDAMDREELRFRELQLRRAAEHARLVSPLRRAVRQIRRSRV